MAFHAESADRLAELERFDERAAELDRARQDALAAELVAAEAVGRRRREVGPLLASAVEAELRRLAMPHASVGVEIGDHPDDHPGDRVQFLLAANPGSPLLPLTRVASGGELARAMLALRLVLSHASNRSEDGRTLVFDEVDAGIGGAAAQAIGDALAQLGEVASGARGDTPRPGGRCRRGAGLGRQDRCATAKRSRTPRRSKERIVSSRSLGCCRVPTPTPRSNMLASSSIAEPRAESRD